MEDYRDSQVCMAKVGLLFLRDCGSMMMNNCVACGRPVCRRHSIESGEGIVCPECAAPKKNLHADPAASQSAQRQSYYNRYDYYPYYYGHTYFYSDNDYRTFDNEEPTHVDPPEEAAAMWGGADDGMES